MTNLIVASDDIYNKGTEDEYFYAFIKDINPSKFDRLVSSLEKYCSDHNFPIEVVARNDFQPATIDIEVHKSKFTDEQEILTTLRLINKHVTSLV